ncbi:MAG: N-acetylmuramoyl-L-alanine amidase family protein [Lachnospiraceae bacterium]|nr:N-acetylmuramoyl-L-alanine amidase family protein [Lachnospiraceae bacterium]
MKLKRITGFLCLLAMIVCCLGTFPAFAASGSSRINSVTIHIKNMVEAGDFFAYDRIVENEPEDGQVGIWVDSAQYELAEVKLLSGSHRSIPMGEVIKLRAVVEITDTDTYSFKSEFTKKNVTISGNSGSCTSVARSDSKLTLTIELEPVKGQYTAPEEVWWSETGSKLGIAKWDASSKGSGYYDVQLRRSGTTIKELTGFNGTSYNFYPYMTVAGKYMVRVRAVPHTTEEKAYAKSSSWVSSDSLTISSRQVSNGAGAEWDDIIITNNDGSISAIAGATSGQAGWIENNGFWYYKYPNGTFKSNGWELIAGQWYAFDSKGRMLTGWYDAPSGRYYLDTSGAMIAGWLYDGYWYYLDANTASPTYGKMLTDTFVMWNGNTYYLDAEGHMAAGWTEIRGAWYYFQPGSGAMARNQWIDTFYVDENGVWRK